MKLRATHITRYWYSEPVSLCHTEVYLAPRTRKSQTVLEHDLSVSPAPETMYPREDYFGNPATFFSIHEPHRELIVTSRSTVDLTPAPPPHLDLPRPGKTCGSRPRAAKLPIPSTPLSSSSNRPRSAWERPSPRMPRSPSPPAARSWCGVNHLSERIYNDFKYDQRATTVTTPVDEVLESKRGVCQDFAHLMIACLRSLGLPARYVSGYVRTGHKFVGGEASHAWVSVWCPTFGWQDFDPTNNTMPHDEHMTVAWGRDYSDVTPVKGVALGGGEQVISVSVDVSEAD